MLQVTGDAIDQQRYRRQLLIDGWGVETQKRLRDSRVFILGAGGLGCPVALNLTSAGVGHITICDADQVEMSNLNRQFLHQEKNVGVNKTESALQFLSAFNSAVDFTTVTQKVTRENVDELVGDADIIMDCVDNFPARHALNQCAIRKKIPLVHGAVWGMEGRVTFLYPPATPCLCCLFPVAPRGEEIPVLGVVACATGSIQATEAIHYLCGGRQSLQGKMLIMDYSTMHFQTLELEKNPNCPICGSAG